MKHAALFDLDGVLVDTEPEYTRIWSSIDQAEPTGVEDFAHKIKGMTLQRILSTYFPKLGQEERVKELLAERELTMNYPVFEGVIDLLKSLRADGIPAAIVTSSNNAKMDRLFEMHNGFREYFDVVITDSDVSHGKPDPECYLLAAKRLNVPAEQCYVFEDSINGARAGRAAGAVVIGLSTTVRAEALEPISDIVVPDLVGFTPDKMLATKRK